MNDTITKENPLQEIEIQSIIHFAQTVNEDGEVQFFTEKEHNFNNENIEEMIIDDENNIILLLKNKENMILKME
jgi:hypothetical protein